MTTSKLALAIALCTTVTAAYAGQRGDRVGRLDTDGDGLVSQTEFDVRDRGFVARIDQDGDDAITLEEVSLHLDARIAGRKEDLDERRTQMQSRIESHFTEADLNQDGMVTTEEAKLAAFTRMDEDNDGYLSKEELSNARKQHKRPNHGRGGHEQDIDDRVI